MIVSITKEELVSNICDNIFVGDHFEYFQEDKIVFSGTIQSFENDVYVVKVQKQ